MNLISATEAYVLMENTDWWESSDRQIAEEILRKCKTIDAEPVVHAHWEKYNDIYGDVCSRCGEASAPDMNYRHCPWCGAKMDEVDENAKI